MRHDVVILRQLVVLDKGYFLIFLEILAKRGKKGGL